MKKFRCEDDILFISKRKDGYYWSWASGGHNEKMHEPLDFIPAIMVYNEKDDKYIRISIKGYYEKVCKIG